MSFVAIIEALTKKAWSEMAELSLPSTPVVSPLSDEYI